MRINKYLAHIGYCSRRKADELIKLGKVAVNGKKAVLGQDVSDSEEITVDGVNLKHTRVKTSVYILNKPKGVVSTAADENNRKTVVDLIKSRERLYPVGRLDLNSTGLILLTNDGDLAYKLTHPKFEVEKEYQVKLNSPLDSNQIMKLEAGIRFRKVNYQADKITPIGHSSYSIVLHGGKNREIRRMIQAVGSEVIELKRVRIGNLELVDLKEGDFRQLKPEDINKLAD